MRGGSGRGRNEDIPITRSGKANDWAIKRVKKIKGKERSYKGTLMFEKIMGQCLFCGLKGQKKVNDRLERIEGRMRNGIEDVDKFKYFM